MGEMILTVNNIFKSYHNGQNKLEVLKDFSLKVSEKEIITISGQSGCGKSTALNILGTLDKPDSGAVLFMGKDINKFDAKELSLFRNTKIGFVFQFHHLLPEFTALENASIPMWIRKKPILDNYVLSLFEALEMMDRINHFPSELSGGERSRVALIRAIINKPAILFADEPTGNLDEKNSIKLVDLLHQINRDFNQTIILTTHNPDVAAIGDRQFILENGLLH
jgi:ABC-type lipoprotein export system ATPase subunit